MLGDADAGAAADVKAAAAFRQLVKRRRIGDADVRSRRHLEPAADHRALHRRHHRPSAELDGFERCVGKARHEDALERLAMAVLRQIEAGAEMLAGAGKHHAAHVAVEILEGLLQFAPQRLAQRVALIGAVEGHDGDRALPFDQQKGCSVAHSLPSSLRGWLRFSAAALRSRPGDHHCTFSPIWPAIRLRWICEEPAAMVAARASRKCRCMSNSIL